MFVGGCMPPPTNIGFVDPSASRRGGLDVQGQVGGGGQFPVQTPGGGGAVHVEPFVSPRLSVPIGLDYVRTRDYNFAPLRVGVRHRVRERLALGGGLGAATIFDRSGVDAAGTADLELIVSATQSRISVSAGLRPGLVFDSGTVAFVALAEPALAIHVTEALSVTATVPFGVWYWFDGPWRQGVGSFFGGGALGVHRRF
jgi:hypothetical protein